MENILQAEGTCLRRNIGKDIAYFYYQYSPAEISGNWSRLTGLYLTDKEKQEIDFSRGENLQALQGQREITRKEVLHAEVTDKITDYYDRVQLNPDLKRIKDIPKAFRERFEEEKQSSRNTTVKRVLKEVDDCIIRGKSASFTVDNAEAILDKRVAALEQLTEESCRQLNRYMLLSEYQKMGCAQYVYITVAENCPECDALEGQIFRIDDAIIGKNMPPMHPNCDCSIGILDKNGRITAIIYNQKTGTQEELERFLDFLQTALDVAGLLPVIGEPADGLNAVIYGLRGDYVNMGLSGMAMIPFAGMLSTGGKFIGKAGKVGDKTADVVKLTGKGKPLQVHHYLSNKNKTYTKLFQKVTGKYGLNLDDWWNKEVLPHVGRHAQKYHEYVLQKIRNYDEVAKGNQKLFLELFEELKKEVRENPGMLYKDYWTK